MACTTTRSLADDSITFAEGLYDRMLTDNDPCLSAHTAQQYAAYKAARAALQTELRGAISEDHPANLMDEAAHAWAGDSFLAGIHFALTAEQFRRALLEAAV